MAVQFPKFRLCRAHARAACAVAVLLLGACGGGSSVKSYVGPNRPPTEVATLQCGAALALVSVDDDRKISGPPNGCHFGLLAGLHTFRVRIENPASSVADRAQKGEQVGEQLVEYTLKGGRTYSLDAIEDQNSPGLWTIVVVDPMTHRFAPLTQVQLR